MTKLVFLLIAGALPILAGCGQNDDFGARPVVSCMTFEWGAGKDSYRMREKFINEHTTSAAVKIAYAPHSTYVTKLLASFAGNIAPDLMYSMNGRHRLFLSKGVFLPLDDFIKGPHGIDLNDFNSTFIREQLMRNGKICALPQTQSTLALFYNRELFRRAGLPDLSTTEPITWDRYRELAQALTRDLDGDGAIDQYGCAPGFDSQQPTYYFYVLNESFGCRTYNEDGTHANFDSEATADAVRFLHSLIYEYKCAPPPLVAQQLGGSLFPANRLGLVVNGPWMAYDFVQTASDLDYGVAPLPYRPGYPRRNMIGGEAIGISSQCHNPAAAWEILKAFISPEFQKLPIQGLPSRLSVMSQPDFKSLPHWEIFRNEMQFGTASFFTVNYDQVSTILRQYAERILSDPGSRPRIPDLLKEMNTKINALL